MANNLETESELKNETVIALELATLFLLPVLTLAALY